MNVIFLTTCRISDINAPGIYTDLMRKFRDEGHDVHIVVPVERQFGQPTHLSESGGVKILSVKTLNIQKANIIEKGIGTILLERQFIRAIKKYLGDIHFDLILYSTPPITFNGVVSFLKRNNPDALSYLLLKDIFPQNAVDLGMFSSKGMIYRYFRHKEIELYKISDFIGCMSPANVEYVLKHNDYLDSSKVEIAPNSIDIASCNASASDKEIVRRKFNLPVNVPIFIYGGNMGKPQGIDYVVEVMKCNANRDDCFFVLIGSGTEFAKLDSWCRNTRPTNVLVLKGLPKKEYEELLSSCDVGLIFLNHKFTIPNYPSRLLSYLVYRMPVLVATDANTDIGKIVENNGFGYKCESDSVDKFNSILEKMLISDRVSMGEKGYRFLLDNYLIENTYSRIMRHIKK